MLHNSDTEDLWETKEEASIADEEIRSIRQDGEVQIDLKQKQIDQALSFLKLEKERTLKYVEQYEKHMEKIQKLESQLDL